jgi:hypothetical protein
VLEILKPATWESPSMPKSEPRAMSAIASEKSEGIPLEYDRSDVWALRMVYDAVASPLDALAPTSAEIIQVRRLLDRMEKAYHAGARSS